MTTIRHHNELNKSAGQQAVDTTLLNFKNDACHHICTDWLVVLRHLF